MYPRTTLCTRKVAGSSVATSGGLTSPEALKASYSLTAEQVGGQGEKAGPTPHELMAGQPTAARSQTGLLTFVGAATTLALLVVGILIVFRNSWPSFSGNGAFLYPGTFSGLAAVSAYSARAFYGWRDPRSE